MKTIKQLVITLMLLALPAASLFAQEGPYVPCAGCEDLTKAPYPDSGLWYNPDQSGSGFNLEIQNGIMAGHYYGYDENGEPEWYLVTSPLTRSEQPGVMWELELQPQRYSGGNCLGCEYQAPATPELLPAIKIEFLQRAYAKVTFSNGTTQFMVPIIYGASGRAYFEDQTPYIFPALPFTEPHKWTWVFKKSGQENEPWNWVSDIYFISSREFGYPDDRYISYGIATYTNPPEVLLPHGDIICGPDEDSGEIGCVLDMANFSDPSNPRIYYQIPIGNFTDSYFFGERDNGDTVQGYRMDYN